MMNGSPFLTYLFVILLAVAPFFVWWLVSPDLALSQLLLSLFLLHLVSVLAVFISIRRFATSLSNRKANAQFASNEQFVSLYERSPVPYLTLSTKGRIVMYNPASVKLFETTSDAMVGRQFANHLSHDEEDIISVILGKLTSDHTLVDEEVKLTTDKGTIKWVLLSVFVFEASGQRLVSMIDITRQKAVDAAKTEFVALATHQLRTPIAAIRWNVELLHKNLKEVVTESQARYLQKIERNVTRMSALIDDFLSVSKLEMGTFATNIETINLTDFGTAAIDEYTEKITENAIVLERYENPPQLSYQTDPRLLHIIISNLLSNAVKYLPPQGTIRYSYEQINNTLVIVVADSGIGVPADEQDKIFTKFFRARNAYNHHAVGTGLGLYIVKQSVEKLGGTIKFTSAEREGTTFTITLPYQT